MVQTRWTHLNRDYSFLTQVEAILLDGHFVLEHGGRSRARSLLQLQRHGRHVASRDDWQRRWLAARHADRRHRPELSRADGGLEVQVPAGRGVPGRAAHRDDGLQDAAGALGQGTDPDRQEDSAARDEERPAVAHQARGLVSPDGEHQLSADDHSERAADAGDDHPQLAGAACRCC